MRHGFLLGIFCLTTFTCVAGEDAFLKAVVDNCGKTFDEAEAMGGGVTGPKGQFQRCTSPTIEVAPDCKIQCVKRGNLLD